MAATTAYQNQLLILVARLALPLHTMLDDFHLCPLRAVSLNLYLPSIAYRKPTGALLKACRPDAYREAVSLLAEPREHISYREIARVCGIGGHTIKAIERAEAATIQERKQLLPHQFACRRKPRRVLLNRMSKKVCAAMLRLFA